MGSRLELHEKLVEILGTRFVFFQPPSSIKLTYPCIIYKRDNENLVYANDDRYLGTKRYLITIVDQNPDSTIPDRLSTFFRYCSFTNHYIVDNLNHNIYTLFY